MSTAPRYPLAVAKGMLYIFFSGDFLPGLSIVCVLNLEKSGASSVTSAPTSSSSSGEKEVTTKENVKHSLSDGQGTAWGGAHITALRDLYERN